MLKTMEPKVRTKSAGATRTELPAKKPRRAFSPQVALHRSSDLSPMPQRQVKAARCDSRGRDDRKCAQTALYFCLDDGHFLCQNCKSLHDEHKMDSIVNILTGQFTQWEKLVARTFEVTKAKLDRNMEKHSWLLSHLKNTSQIAPDINPFTLPHIFKNFAKKLTEKRR